MTPIQELFLIVLVYYSTLTGTVTAYSPANLDPRWGGVARWTGQAPVVGITAACPPEWANHKVYIEGYGWRWCHDTPRTPWYNDGTPHIDIYLGSQEEALRHGIQYLTLWKEREQWQSSTTLD